MPTPNIYIVEEYIHLYIVYDIQEPLGILLKWEHNVYLSSSKEVEVVSWGCWAEGTKGTELAALSTPEASLKRLVPLVSHLAVWEPLPSVSYWVLPEQTLVL